MISQCQGEPISEHFPLKRNTLGTIYMLNTGRIKEKLKRDMKKPVFTDSQIALNKV